MKKMFVAVFALFVFAAVFAAVPVAEIPASAGTLTVNEETAESEENFLVLEDDKDFIKWVDFNPKADLMQKVYQLDKGSVGSAVHYDFVSILSYIACQNGNKFNTKKDLKTLSKLKAKLDAGQTMEEIVGENKYYSYYLNAYNAVFADWIGWYRVDGGEPEYGLKAYCPIAKGFGYSDFDDFGNSRSYGFKRVHLGHDMFGSVGAPIVATEGGTITELGWNRYGGWRVGIRSDDGLRYYYYAHLRKNKPYAAGVEKGGRVEAGQVIGYLGVTGYSRKENVNMKGAPHLHFGLQLIFDKSQEDGSGEIWIDIFELTKFLRQNNRAKVEKSENGHWYSTGLRKGVEEAN